MNGAKQLNGGKNVEGSGHGRQKMAGRQTKPAEQFTAGGHSQRILRPAQALKKQTAHSWPAWQQKQQLQINVGLSLAVQVSGGSAVVLALKKAGSDLPNVPTPPIAFACHCPYPLP